MLSVEGRLRAAGSVRLLHRAGRRRTARRVRHARDPRRRPLGHHRRRSRRRRPRPAGRARSSPPAARSAASARPGSWCASRRPRRGARRAASTSTARSPRTSAGAPAGRRCTRRSTATRPATRVGAVASPRRARRAELEGGAAQVVGADVPLGRRRVRRRPGAARRAGRGAAPARTRPRSVTRPPAWTGWSRARCSRPRALAGKVQGRRTTVDPTPPLAAARRAPPGGVRLATELGGARVPRTRRVVVRARGEPATPLANGGAFGGKVASPAPRTRRGARRADRARRPRRVLARKTSSASARSARRSPPRACWDDGTVRVRGVVAGDVAPLRRADRVALRRSRRSASGRPRPFPGPPTSSRVRAVGLAERAVLRRRRARTPPASIAAR